MTDNYDQLALSWVRKEINNTLDQARQGLENFAEDTQDQTQIQFCINCLHQVQGTLQMLEFSGAAKLAQEMESLAEKMADNKKVAVESSFEVLMRALLQMPGYLERVEEGQKDIPVILLPLINELRAASETKPISERELFSAGRIDVVPPKAIETVSEEDKTTEFGDNAKKLRAHYQKGLTGIIRGQSVKESLSRIHKVLLRLEALTEGHPVSRLWWVADGFIFSIAEAGFYKKKEVHLLLSQVDKQIKRLSDVGEIALDDKIADSLLSELLYYVARSKSSHERIVALKNEFNLAAGLADSEEIKARQQRLARPDSAAVTNVVEAINEELATVKDQLDLFVRAQAKDPSQLKSLVESLNRISDTLTLLELAIPRDVIRQQVSSIQTFLDGNKMPDDGLIMDVAGALLFVEANLKNVNLDKQNDQPQEADLTVLSEVHAKESQVDEATETLIKVARKSMLSAKDCMINYIASGFERSALADVPSMLDEVLGGARIVGFDAAAEVLEVANSFIQERIIAVERQPKEEYLDALADVITSVEYYLEASEDGSHRGVDSILKGANKSMQVLSQALIEEVDLPVDAIEEAPEKPLIETTAQVIPMVTPAADKQIDETLIDEEVLEIFLEEAEEEIETIEEMLPRWTNNSQDEEALTTLRRSFHTLKGSGRLVGAKILGDVSWAVENTLNKVIEEAIPAELPVTSLLNEAFAMLPALVAAFSSQSAVTVNYQTLIAKAEHISAGKPLADFVEPTTLESIEEQVVEEVVSNEAEEASTKEEAIDPVLLEIFTAEADNHLKSINEFIQAAPPEGSTAVTDELIRALHTLKGSAHMASVEPIASIAGPWEKYARLLKGSGQRFSQTAVKLLAQSHELLLATLARLQVSEAYDQEAILVQLSALDELKAGSQLVDESNVSQRDQQLVSIFLTEGLDILNEVNVLNAKLLAGNADTAEKSALVSELQAFYQGAKMLSIGDVESLAEAAQSVADYAVEQDKTDSEFSNLLSETVDALIMMLNQLASQEDLASPQVLINKIKSWIETNDSEPTPDDMDVELIELFVEEGEELIEAARELLVRWKDNLNNKELTSELRRIYHTIKGSSRMAGAMNIGELGHAVEDVFNTALDFGRKLSSQDFQVTTNATDTLESMVATLKKLHWPNPELNAIAAIRNLLSPEEQSVSGVSAIENDVSEVVMDASDSLQIEPLEVEPEPEVVEPEEFTIDVPEIAVAQTETSELESETSLDEPLVIEIPEEDNFDVESLEADSQETASSASDALQFEPLLEEPEVEAEVESQTEAVETPEIESTHDSLDETALDETDLLPVIEVEETTSVDELAIDGVSLDDEIPMVEETVDENEMALEFELPHGDDQEDHKEESEELVSVELNSDSFEISEVDEDTEIAGEISDEISDTEEEKQAIQEADILEETDSLEEELVASEQQDDQSVIETLPAEKRSSTEVTSADTIAPSAPVVVTGDIHHVDLDEDGEEVLEIYLEEAEELLVALDEALHDWSSDLENKSAIDLLQRTLHTFKGGARLSDLIILGDLTHEMETYFEKVSGGQLTASNEAVAFLLQGYDVIESLVNEVKDHRQMTRPTAYMVSLDSLIKGESITALAVAVEEAPEESVAAEINESMAVDLADKVENQTKVKSAEVVSFEAKKQLQEDNRQKSTQAAEVVRVTSDQLENLVNLAGETSIFRSRLEQQMSVLRYNLDEMNATVDRLRDQLRNLDIETDAQISYRREVSGAIEYEDFDPLEMDRYTRQQELTRGLSESAVDLVSLKETLDLLTADSETLLLQQGRVNTEMQESLMRTRMIPFESLVPRLRRMVRQISTELGKTIELSISADGEMDRTVLERMVAPLEHMLRNAMDHGIESPQERRANQKPESGSVKISMFREGNEVFIKLQDDGRGLNLKAIRKKATEKGLITESSELTDHELQQLILEAGFSTAEQITQISGRGVGMDVVSSEIKQLGGIIEIDSHQGIGTTFTVKLPFTMSMNHALMVRIGEDIYAIPLSNIEGIVRVSPFELEEYYADTTTSFEYAGIDYSMFYLGQVLDHHTGANLAGVTQPLPVLLLHGADHPTALQVDELLGSREIVVKSIGSQLSSISGLSGATILGDGRVVVILDMPALIRRIDATSLAADEEASIVEEVGVPTVMVVDDSITVRKVTTRLLERHDFNVITAKDGVDALAILGEQKPDVMLLDIEMPRMDGFELATIIRHDDHLKDLPIIMITSRTGEKHRERAEQIGVNQYMGKPYNEVDLLESISALLPIMS